MAERQTADFSGGGDVAFDKRRGDVQTARHVVEAVTGVVGGKICGGIDIERKEIVDGIRVFSAVGPVNTRGGQLWPGGGGAVELVLESGGQGLVCGGRGTGKAL